jgi:hypothetical protein
MLLYTNKANNVFVLVDEKFGNRDISPVRTHSRVQERGLSAMTDLRSGNFLLASPNARFTANHPSTFADLADWNMPPGRIVFLADVEHPARLDEGLGRLAAVVRQAQLGVAA